MTNLSKLMSADDNDDISAWSHQVSGKESEFAGWIRELSVIFLDEKESLDRRKNALYAIQTMWPQIFSQDETFVVTKELMEELMKLIWTDIFQKVGELADRAIPVLMNVTRNFLKQKRLQ
ncbi:MAG: hypothetical protein G01um101419_589 [Parcubacteria group bacterium Gr01-1014_19]|nr:MAG: hypothetical protein G01um101419_589 [Parcubacteria group bacterium Gr01-1014_19]